MGTPYLFYLENRFTQKKIILVKISFKRKYFVKKKKLQYLFWSNFLLKDEEKYFSDQKHNFSTQSTKIKEIPKMDY
jgi:hypothetical protein